MTSVKVQVIAELGSTHDGSLGNALRLIHVAAECGVDDVKLQDHRWQKVTAEHPPWAAESFVLSTGELLESRQDYIARTCFEQSEWRTLSRCAQHCGVGFVVSPFSVEAVGALEQLPHLTGYKVASGQVTNLPMLEAIAATGKRVFLSSGMSTVAELGRAVAMFERREQALALMHCTSEYPCPPARVGLNVVSEWCRAHPGCIGLSDHTTGVAASLAAITLGARVIERHVTLSRRMYGTDAGHSFEPRELADFICEVRELEVMLSHDVDKDALAGTPEMQRMRAMFLDRGATP